MSAQQIQFPDRETVADKLAAMDGSDQAFLKLLFENPEQDEALLAGVQFFLDRQAEARFLNALKLERCGEWLGHNAPARLQMPLTEAARSGQHPAYVAFRDGLKKSGGLERAFRKSPV